MPPRTREGRLAEHGLVQVGYRVVRLGTGPDCLRPATRAKKTASAFKDPFQQVALYR